MSLNANPPKITLSCWIAAHVLALGALAIGTVLESFFIYKLADTVLKNEPWQDWVGLAAGSIFVPCILVASMWYYLFHLAVRMEFGERLCIHTILKKREVDWPDVARFELLDTDNIRTRIKSVMPIHIMLTDGTQFGIWTSVTEAEAALNFVRAKPWAKNWAGAPWGRILPVLAILLGLFIAVGGIVAAMLTERNQIFFLVGGIIAGLLGMGYGGFHLIWRPIYYRPLAGHSSENAFMGILR